MTDLDVFDTEQGGRTLTLLIGGLMLASKRHAVMTTILVRIILAYPFTSRCCQKTVDVETVRLLQIAVNVWVGSCQYVRKTKLSTVRKHQRIDYALAIAK